MLWLLFGLLTALFFALFHIFNKKYVAKSDAEYFAYIILVFSTIAAIPLILLLREKLVFNYYWLVGMIFIGIIIWITRVLYTKSLKVAEVSKTVPLLSITPLFTLIIAMVWLGEFPSPMGITGIIVLISGIYLFNYQKGQGSIFEPFLLIFKNKGALLMFIVALIYGVGSVIDKFVINHSNPLSIILFNSAFASFFQTIYLSIKDKNYFIPKARKVIKENWRGGLVITVFFYLFITTQIYGISLIHTVYIIALKRMSVLFVVIIAYFVFKERKSFTYVLGGTILMLLGGVLMLF